MLKIPGIMAVTIFEDLQDDADVAHCCSRGCFRQLGQTLLLCA
jgi:hypothetical protein